MSLYILFILGFLPPSSNANVWPVLSEGVLMHSAGISNYKSGLGAVFNEEALVEGKTGSLCHLAKHCGNHPAAQIHCDVILLSPLCG